MITSPYRHPFIGLIFLAIALAGCDPVTKKIDDAITQQAAEVVKNPDSALEVGRLGDGYFQRYQQSRDPKDLIKASDYYQQALQKEPGFLGAQIQLYRTAALLFAVDPSTQSLKRLNQTWERYQQLHTDNVSPPNTVVAINLIKASYDETKTLKQIAAANELLTTPVAVTKPYHDTVIKLAQKLFKLAIKQNPKHPDAAYILGLTYMDEKNIPLAIASFNKAHKLKPDYPAFAISLAEAYMELRPGDKRCPPTAKSYTKAAKILKKALANSKRDDEIHALMYEAYRGAGKYPLAQFAIKNARAIKDSDDNRSDYLDSLFFLGKFQQMEDQGPAMLGVGEFESTFIHQRALSAMVQGRYPQALERLKKLQKQDPEHRYYWFDAALAIRAISGEAAAQKFVQTMPGTALQDRPWLSQIYRYMAGEQDTQALLDQANSRCKQAEAHFLIGFKAYQDGDNRQAQHHLQAVKDANIGNYLETPMARYLLKKIDR